MSDDDYRFDDDIFTADDDHSIKNLKKELLHKSARRLKHDHALRFHRRCMQENVVPQEFLLRRPNHLEDDQARDILEEASKRLMRVHIEREETTLRLLDEEVKKCQTSLREIIGEAETETLLNRSFEKIEKYRTNILVKHYDKRLSSLHQITNEPDRIPPECRVEMDPKSLDFLSRGQYHPMPPGDFIEQLACKLEIYFKDEPDKSQAVTQNVIKILKKFSTKERKSERRLLNELLDRTRDDLAILSRYDNDAFFVMSHNSYMAKMRLGLKAEVKSPVDENVVEVVKLIESGTLSEDLRLSAPHMPKLFGVIGPGRETTWCMRKVLDLSDTLVWNLLGVLYKILAPYIFETSIGDRGDFSKRLDALASRNFDEVYLAKLSIENTREFLSISTLLKRIEYLTNWHCVDCEEILNLAARASSCWLFDGKYYSAYYKVMTEDLPEGTLDVMMAFVENITKFQGVYCFKSGCEILTVGDRVDVESVISDFERNCIHQKINFHIEQGTEINFVGMQLKIVDGKMQYECIENQNDSQYTYPRDDVLVLPPMSPPISSRIVRCLKKNDISAVPSPPFTIREHFKRAISRVDPLSYAGIYRFSCLCGCAYVGKTKRTIRSRMKEHKTDLKLNKGPSIRGHVRSTACPIGNRKSKIKIDDVVSVARVTDSYEALCIRESIEIMKASDNMNENKGIKINVWWMAYFHMTAI